MANDVDPIEMAHYEPSHLDLHCLQKYLSWSTGLQWLNRKAEKKSFVSCIIKQKQWRRQSKILEGT